MPSKKKLLQDSGCLNPSVEDVQDASFEKIDFFDPEDLVQVKYEMLRKAQSGDRSAVQAARDFGYSRPAYYRAKGEFDRAGLPGLIPKKRGPKGGHKLTDEVVDFLLRAIELEPAIGSTDLASRVQGAFGFSVHARSVERALERRKKNPT